MGSARGGGDEGAMNGGCGVVVVKVSGVVKQFNSGAMAEVGWLHGTGRYSAGCLYRTGAYAGQRCVYMTSPISVQELYKFDPPPPLKYPYKICTILTSSFPNIRTGQGCCARVYQDNGGVQGTEGGCTRCQDNRGCTEQEGCTEQGVCTGQGEKPCIRQECRDFHGRCDMPCLPW